MDINAFYNIVCLKCHTRVDCRQIDGYPLDWQTVPCPDCGGHATPDLEHPYYISENERRLIEENRRLKKIISGLQDRMMKRGRAYELISPIPDHR